MLSDLRVMALKMQTLIYIFLHEMRLKVIHKQLQSALIAICIFPKNSTKNI